MRIYFLDEELDDKELVTVRDLLSELGKSAFADGVDQVRIPMVLPVCSTDGTFDIPIEKQIRLICSNLVNAGLERDRGYQVVFVMPQETHWGIKFQEAIMELTGFWPYVVKRYWPDNEGRMRKGSICVIDSHGLIGEKE